MSRIQQRGCASAAEHLKVVKRARPPKIQTEWPTTVAVCRLRAAGLVPVVFGRLQCIDAGHAEWHETRSCCVDRTEINHEEVLARVRVQTSAEHNQRVV